MPASVFRYYFYELWAVHYAPTALLMACDFRDIVFQRDPFVHHVGEWLPEFQLVLFQVPVFTFSSWFISPLRPYDAYPSSAVLAGVPPEHGDQPLPLQPPRGAGVLRRRDPSHAGPPRHRQLRRRHGDPGTTPRFALITTLTSIYHNCIAVCVCGRTRCWCGRTT